MQYFKHMVDASDDEFIEGLIARFGLEGYARYFLILEAIALQMERGSDKCSVTYSWETWQKILHGKRFKLETFLEHCQNESKLFLERSENKLEMKCPKLLELIGGTKDAI
jgi:hypothetical protein